MHEAMEWVIQEAPHHVEDAGEDTEEDCDHRSVSDDGDIEKLKRAIDVSANYSNGSVIGADEGAFPSSLPSPVDVAVAAVTPTSGARSRAHRTPHEPSFWLPPISHPPRITRKDIRHGARTIPQAVEGKHQRVSVIDQASQKHSQLIAPPSIQSYPLTSDELNVLSLGSYHVHNIGKTRGNRHYPLSLISYAHRFVSSSGPDRVLRP